MIKVRNKVMHEALIAFGSNLGDRFKNLKLAINFLDSLPKTKITRVSDVYETRPADVIDKQNFYLNCCAILNTEFDPHILLGCCLGIETSLGRERSYKNSPRTIDIDVIF